MNTANPIATPSTASSSAMTNNTHEGPPQSVRMPAKEQLKSAYKDAKNFLSAKSTVTRQGTRLPPLGETPRQASQAGIVLPPIRAKPTPSRDTDPEAPSPDPLPNYSDAVGNNSARDSDNNNHTAQETSFSSHHNGLPNGSAHTSNGGVPGTSSVTAGMFETSQSRTVIPASTSMTPQPTLSEQQREALEREKHIKENGVRTCPILAVLSIFLCCPLSGLMTAFLSLKAENSYYEGEYLLAHNEARVSRICLIVTFVCGLLIYTGVIIWIIVGVTR